LLRTLALSGTGAVVALVALVALLGVVGAARDRGDGRGAGASDALALFPLPGERSQPVEVIELTVGAAGGQLRLGDRAEVTVPEGALAEAALLKVERFEPGFETLDYTVGSSALYRLTLGNGEHKVDPPVTLRIPWAPERTMVASLEDGKWVSMRTSGGDAVTVYVDHFSTRTILALGASLASGLRTSGEQIARVLPRWDLGPAIREKEAAHRERIRARNAATQQFYGVDDVTTKAHGAICEEFRTVVLANRDGFTFQPPEPRPGIVALTKHLGDAGKPSAGDSAAQWFWDATQASHETIRQRVVSAGLGHPISPAAVLRIAIEANGGNVPLGVLAAHNLLKNVAYEGRQLADPTENYDGGILDVTERDGQFAASIETWRRGSAYSPSGRYDKMGPLYHIFAAMAARVWGGGGYGQAVVSAEAVLRGVGWERDIPDPDKGAADECGLEIGAWLATLEDAVALAFEPVTAKVEAGKPLPLTLTVSHLGDEGISIALTVISGEASLSRAGISVSRASSSSSCDVAGSTAVCGFTVTPADTKEITVEARSGKTVATLTLAGEVCVEGTPPPIPLTGGAQRIENSSFSFCFPGAGGDVTGRLVYDVYAEDSFRWGNEPKEITCTYRMEISYDFTGTFAAPEFSGTVAAWLEVDAETLSGSECDIHRSTPSRGPFDGGGWAGTFDGDRLRVTLGVVAGAPPFVLEGTAR
jgi:hypothetical protein